MIEHDDIYSMAWDLLERLYKVNCEERSSFTDELDGLAIQCENVFDAIGFCKDKETLESVMTSLCMAWENGAAYEEGKKEDEFEIFRDVLDTVLDKWEDRELKEIEL